MALTLKINSTSASKWRPFVKIIITQKKTAFFGGSISTCVNYIKRPLHAKFDAFNQKCTIFSHNRLTIRFICESNGLESRLRAVSLSAHG